jgi:histidinol dehydrogenase
VVLDLLDARLEPGPARLERPAAHRGSDVESEVKDIVNDVRLRGDAAVVEYTSRFDGVRLEPDGLRVGPADIGASRDLVPPDLITALEAMATTCRRTGERDLSQSWLDRDNPVVVGELVRPLRRTAIYVAGPRGNPSLVLSGAVAARVAGVEGIAVCSPPGASGEIAESTLAACSVAGVDEVYRMGGAQAVAAFAYGTETVRPVESVVGAGGRFVTCAQRLVRGWVGTGPQSGPSELVVIADETSSPLLIAADLTANAARGPAGTHVVLSAAEGLLQDVLAALDAQVASLHGGDDIENALIEGGRAVLVRDLDHALETVNAFAPQQLVLAIASPQEALDRLRNAGSVMLGDSTPLSALAYLTGRGGVLPTGGSARWDSRLSPRNFVTTIPVSGTDRAALHDAAPGVMALTEAEGSAADYLALSLRLDG